MTTTVSAILLTLSVMILPTLNPKMNPEKLKEQIKAELAKQKGTFGIAFKNIQTGEEILINERINFHAASTMKTPVLIEAYKQAEAGKFNIDQPILVKNEFKSIVDGSLYSLDAGDDSDSLLYTKVGTKLPIYDLLYLMIIKSSNLATNIIIDLVGAQNANKTMRELGAHDIQVLRGVEDSKAFQKGMNNTTTAYDQMLIFEAMATGKIVNKKSSDAMIKILLDQAFNDKIPAQLPKNVKVAHKTGWIKGINHDAGIVYLPDGRKYVLVLLSKEMTDDKAGVAAMANVSKMVYDYFVGS
ncbi:serine hydrolase [Daejeonella lutea]|uniref:beta-lactamase n=1 Tax=Daejeonella lutea TaxID=572036 RepID=A0A1T5B9D6_9SPHI|nr:serine hydrolase [Daejeonella lutea]SKB43677.1 beta-lactamase class A [Daejeonella lutea]